MTEMKQTIWDEFVNPSRPKTLNEARQELNRGLDKGVRCQCCGQFAKIYRRKLNSGMARWLIALYQASIAKPEQPFFHVNSLMKIVAAQSQNITYGSSDFGKLRHWEMIEEKPNADVTKKQSGYWKITDDGKAFVRRQRKVQKYVLLYNNNCVGFDGPDISIIDSLGSHFSYSDLMSNL